MTWNGRSEKYFKVNLGNQRSETLPQQIALTAFRTPDSASVRVMLVTNSCISVFM